MGITVYGIKNCNSMKKTFDWFKENDIPYEFVDYKKTSPSKEQIQTWIEQLGWDQVINKKGMTWRKLDDQVKEGIDQGNAAELALSNLSIVKRPLIDKKGKVNVGFDVEAFEKLFA